MEKNIVELVSSLSVVAVFLGGVTVAVTQLVKKATPLRTKYAPVVSVVTGILLALFFIGEVSFPIRVLMGVIVGLTASGIYSGVKSVRE
jgi:hypothetical protein